MSKEDHFAALFRRHGEPIRAHEAPPDSQRRLSQMIGFYTSLDTSIYTGVLENMSFNAVASKNPSGEYIALYFGAITQLTFYAYLVFSDPDLYKTIGDISVEHCETRIFDILRGEDVIPAHEYRFIPNCPIRRNVAERIAECACLILFLHEAGHIRGCHLDIILDELGATEHKEIGIEPITEEESLLLRALELEADNVALINSLAIWRELARRTGIHTVDVLGPTRSWLLAAELLYWVMSFNHDRVRHDNLASHPSVLTRFMNIRMIMRKQESEDTELREAFRDPDCTLLPWVIKHNLSSSVLTYFREEITKEKVKEWAELQRTIRSMLPKIEQYQDKRATRIALNSQGAGLEHREESKGLPNQAL